MKGKIAEIFDSFQGEGFYVGERQLFVRFYGCNLSCKFCDTKLSVFCEYTARELFEKIESYGGGFHSICFTGGEPLLQKDFLKEILKLTSQAGYKNYLETNGTLPDALAEVIDDLQIVAMDLKLPSSTGLSDFWHAHRRFLEIASGKEVFLKAVISESADKEEFNQGVKLIRETNRSAMLVLQPDSGEDYNRIEGKIENFRDSCIDNEVTACIIPQMHKIIGVR